MAKTGMRAVRSVAIWFTSLGFFTWACGDSANDIKGGLGSVCSKDGDCQATLACAFGSCHKTCEEPSNCGVGLLCVNRPNTPTPTNASAGVCQLPEEAVCSDTQPCPIGQKCSATGQCRDSCDERNSCGKGLVCSSFKLCERPAEPGSGGAPGTQPGEGGEAGRAQPATGGGGGSPPATGGAGGSGGGPSELTGGVGGEGGWTGSSGGAPVGLGGDTGSGGVGPWVAGETCESDDGGNEPEDAQTALVGARVQSCLQAKGDTDYFVFTAPEKPLQGGYFVLSADVGTSAALHMTLESVEGGDALMSWDGQLGESVFAWVAVAPGSSFRVGVSAASWTAATDIVFRARFSGVRDEFSPNGTWEEAKHISLGSSIQGYAFAGFSSSAPPQGTDFDDFFAVHLDAGELNARLVPAADARGEIRLLDSEGNEVSGGRVFQGVAGKPIELFMPRVAEGDYILRVMLFGEMPESVGGGARPASHVTDPYTFTVQQ